jgi:protein-S-isoprenylcysteine O-methyltransferase Ste14
MVCGETNGHDAAGACVSDTRRALDRARGVGGLAAAVSLFVVLAGVVWMVLPFVGVIALHVRFDPFFPLRGRWLAPFFTPSYHPLGAPLVIIGSAVFLFGAWQVYRVKFRGGGVVTGVLYRWVRHPQYTALAVVGVGLVLLWPRYNTLLALVTMCFLYFALARSEERVMTEAHGDSYLSYMGATSAFVPGDRRLFRLPPPRRATFHRTVAWMGAWLIALAVAFAAAFASSAYWIAHRPLPLVQAGNAVGLERLVYPPDRRRTRDVVLEFFGGRRNMARLRREEHSRDRLRTCLELLGADHRVGARLSTLEGPYVVAAVPLHPARTFFRQERRHHGDSVAGVYRVYLAAVAKGDGSAVPPRHAFNGYLKGKQQKVLLSSLVDPSKGRVLQVVPVAFEKQFLDFWDRLLDKTTFG